MTRYFLITGGGTGAKVAEAYVHLCASGCGPDELHLMVLDADTKNGNVARTTDTITVYNKVRPWGWRVQPKKGQPIEFFRTAIYPYYLTDRVSNALGGTLVQSAGPDDGLHDVLDLLYDGEEQENDNQFGFLARPNLGSLILGEHLEHQLQNAEPGKRFIRALRDALSSEKLVQVMVAASIFGGTGASLLPVGRNCVLDVLDLAPSDDNRKKLRFAALMMLPYFLPRAKVGTVDPERFLLDTSLALQYYGLSQFAEAGGYERIYLVGSDHPGRGSHQLQKPVSGGSEQTNPAFVEEWLGALAIQHFATHGVIPPGEAERVLVYNRKVDHDDPAADQAGKHGWITWEDLPCKTAVRDANLTEQLACLVHLAAFFLRPAPSGRGLAAGLDALLTQAPGRQIEFFAWFNALLDGWGKLRWEEYKSLAASGRGERWETLQARVGDSSINRLRADLGEYLTRLLGWAFNALQSPGMDLLDAPSGKELDGDYARLYSGMCDVSPEEILQENISQKPYANDNVLARLVRAAMVAIVRDRSNTYTARPGGETVQIRRRRDHIERAIVPRIRPEDMEAAATSLGRRAAYSAYFNH